MSEFRTMTLTPEKINVLFTCVSAKKFDEHKYSIQFRAVLNDLYIQMIGDYNELTSLQPTSKTISENLLELNDDNTEVLLECVRSVRMVYDKYSPEFVVTLEEVFQELFEAWNINFKRVRK